MPTEDTGTQGVVNDSPAAQEVSQQAAPTPSAQEPARSAPQAPVGQPYNQNNADVPPTPKNAVEAPQNPNEPYQFDKTGDAGLDYALDKAAEWGYTIESPAIQAALGSGDFSLLRMELATNQDAVGADKLIDFVENLWHTTKERNQREQDAIEAEAAQATEEIFGGKEATEEAFAWFADQYDENNPEDLEELNMVNFLLSKGGVPARFAARALKMAYDNAVGSVERSPVPTVAAPAAQPMKVPTTTAEYKAAYLALKKKYGDSVYTSPEYAQLRASVIR